MSRVSDSKGSDKGKTHNNCMQRIGNKSACLPLMLALNVGLGVMTESEIGWQLVKFERGGAHEGLAS